MTVSTFDKVPKCVSNTWLRDWFSSTSRFAEWTLACLGMLWGFMFSWLNLTLVHWLGSNMNRPGWWLQHSPKSYIYQPSMVGGYFASQHLSMTNQPIMEMWVVQDWSVHPRFFNVSWEEMMNFDYEPWPPRITGPFLCTQNYTPIPYHHWTIKNC